MTIGKLYGIDIGGGGGVSAHADLTGLSADDHTQYVLHNYATGTNNIIVGVGANVLEAASSYNILMGDNAGDHITTGNDNICMGRNAGDAINTANGNIFLGYEAGSNMQTGANNIGIGYRAGYSSTAGAGLVYIGYSAGEVSDSAVYCVGIGYRALRYSNGWRNTALGHLAGEGTNGSNFSDSTCIGYNTGVAKTTGGTDVVIGARAGERLTTGSRNIAIGVQCLHNNRTGNDNTAIGYLALYSESSTDPNYNIAIGNYALRYANSSTNYNTAVGFTAMGYQTDSGQYNIAIGGSAGRAASGHYTQRSVFVGYESGENGEIGANNNVMLGYQSGNSVISGSGNVFLGYQAGYSVTNDSNKLYIENSNSSSPLIYGEFDNNLVKINGDLDVTGDVIGLQTSKTVTNPTDAGTTGDICWDSNYIYICVATSTWKRAALSTWGS